MREHASSLENSLAQKESQLTQLTSETSSLLRDKDREISELNSTIATLQDNDSHLKSELEQALNDALLEKQRANDTQRQLAMKEEELVHLKSLPSNERDLQSLKEQVSLLEQVKNDLQVCYIFSIKIYSCSTCTVYMLHVFFSDLGLSHKLFGLENIIVVTFK